MYTRYCAEENSRIDKVRDNSLDLRQTRLAHTDKVFPNLDYYRQAPAPAASSDFLDAQVEEAEVRRAHYYTMNVAINAAVTWGVANFVLNAVNILNPSKDVLALATVEIELQGMAVGMLAFFRLVP